MITNVFGVGASHPGSSKNLPVSILYGQASQSGGSRSCPRVLPKIQSEAQRIGERIALMARKSRAPQKRGDRTINRLTERRIGARNSRVAALRG